MRPCWFFFFNDTATTEIYTLSLHDALPISRTREGTDARQSARGRERRAHGAVRSEEHTSELQSRSDIVCRLLLEKKNHTGYRNPTLSMTRSFIRSLEKPPLLILQHMNWPTT